MQAMKWSRDNLEAMVKDLLEENKRLTRINWGRILALAFFIFWAVTVWNYFWTYPQQSIKPSKCFAEGISSKKSQPN